MIHNETTFIGTILPRRYYFSLVAGAMGMMPGVAVAEMLPERSGEERRVTDVISGGNMRRPSMAGSAVKQGLRQDGRSAPDAPGGLREVPAPEAVIATPRTRVPPTHVPQTHDRANDRADDSLNSRGARIVREEREADPPPASPHDVAGQAGMNPEVAAPRRRPLPLAADVSAADVPAVDVPGSVEVPHALVLPPAPAVVAPRQNASDSTVLAQTRRYTDERIGELRERVQDLDRINRKGIAAVAALQMTTPYAPGRVAVNAGTALYRGQGAFAVGASYWTKSGNFNVNAGVATAGGNSTVIRAGVGWLF